MICFTTLARLSLPSTDPDCQNKSAEIKSHHTSAAQLIVAIK